MKLNKIIVFLFYVLVFCLFSTNAQDQQESTSGNSCGMSDPDCHPANAPVKCPGGIIPIPRAKGCKCCS